MKLVLSFIAFFCALQSVAQDSVVITEKIGYSAQISNDKGDWWQSNLEASSREKLFDTIIDNVYSGKLQAYSLDEKYQPNPDPKYKITIAQVDSIMNPISVSYVMDKETGKRKSVSVENPIDRNDIASVYTIESWEYDQKEQRLIKNVDGMSFNINVYGSDNKLRGEKHLFFVWFE